MTGSDQRVPITLLTGFLGAGKTTILSRVLNRPGFERTCAIINEFGDIGLDHDLIEASDDDVILMAKGCLCCTIRGSLADTLRDIVKRQDQGRLGAIDRIVIETTGLADPFPVLQMLLNDGFVAERFRIAGVVCAVDAEQGARLFAQRLEAVRQVLAADRILVTKGDLADRKTVETLDANLERLNPTAEIHHGSHGDVPAETVFADHAPANRRTASSPAALSHDDIETFVIGFEDSLSPDRIAEVSDCLRRLAGPGLWRAKGLLWPEAGPPLALNAAGARVHPLRPVEHLADADRVSRIVFIVAAGLRPGIESTLAALGGHHASAEPMGAWR